MSLNRWRNERLLREFSTRLRGVLMKWISRIGKDDAVSAELNANVAGWGKGDETVCVIGCCF